MLKYENEILDTAFTITKETLSPKKQWVYDAFKVYADQVEATDDMTYDGWQEDIENVLSQIR